MAGEITGVTCGVGVRMDALCSKCRQLFTDDRSLIWFKRLIDWQRHCWNVWQYPPFIRHFWKVPRWQMVPDASRCQGGCLCLSSWRGRNARMTHQASASLWSWKSPVCCVVTGSLKPGCIAPPVLGTRTGTRGLSAAAGPERVQWAPRVSRGWRQEPSLWWLVSDQSARIVTRDILQSSWHTCHHSCHNWTSEHTGTGKSRAGVMACCCHPALIFLQVKWPVISESDKCEWDQWHLTAARANTLVPIQGPDLRRGAFCKLDLLS